MYWSNLIHICPFLSCILLVNLYQQSHELFQHPLNQHQEHQQKSKITFKGAGYRPPVIFKTLPLALSKNFSRSHSCCNAKSIALSIKVLFLFLFVNFCPEANFLAASTAISSKYSNDQTFLLVCLSQAQEELQVDLSNQLLKLYQLYMIYQLKPYLIQQTKSSTFTFYSNTIPVVRARLTLISDISFEIPTSLHSAIVCECVRARLRIKWTARRK
ncbi:hypothetical protein AGLY_014371 [Aphis glycines]|uniref:Uncharacterized protein n=1 Tax=Aphis glycines TaxID=307491 RepID=A0A6G0T3T6_APHGL|nr:hypothetical protein AGLY_014371 [Aphis glycines]